MTMSSVMFIKKVLRKGSRAACLVREGPGCTAMRREMKPSRHYCSERENVSILKKDNEAFGFNITTYENNTTLCTCVCSVKENSPAESAGLRTGDVIICINSIRVEGFEHQQIVDLIRRSLCFLKIEIIRGTSLKQKELQKKMVQLQTQLREKRAELQMLIMQEERLTGGERRDRLSQTFLASAEPCALPQSSSSNLRP